MMLEEQIQKYVKTSINIIIMKKAWVPVPYYYNSPLSKLSIPTKLPHKLGYIPKFIKK
jgi:hypothetical protein